MKSLNHIFLGFSPVSPANDNTQITDDTKTQIMYITTSSVEYIKAQGKKIILSNSIEVKKSFIIALAKHCGIYLSEKILFDISIFITTFSEYIETDEENFFIEYNAIYNFLNSSKIPEIDRLNLMIELLISLLDEDIFDKLNGLEDDIKSDFEKVILEILENEKIPERFTKDDVYFLIDISISMGFFERFPKNLFSIFANFLEDEFIKSKGFDLSGQSLGFYLFKKEIIKSVEKAQQSLRQLQILVLNGNYSQKPLVIGFKNFPGSSQHFIIYQENELFTPKEDNANTSIFSDKTLFVEELDRLMTVYSRSLKYGNIFSVSTYKMSGGKGTSPTSNDNYNHNFTSIAA